MDRRRRHAHGVEYIDALMSWLSVALSTVWTFIER